MIRSLPSRPSLRYLQLEAKDLKKALSFARTYGDNDVCRILRGLPKFASMSDRQIHAANVGLQEIQHALAVDYGFASWAELKNRVTASDVVGIELSDDDRRRLRMWDEGSSMGNVAEMLQEHGAAGQEMLDLLKLERSLEPVSEEAWAIRRNQGLEPPDVAFMARLDACIASIAAGSLVEPDFTQVNEILRRQRQIVEDYRLAMEHWRAGWDRDRTGREIAIDPAILNEVYDNLGPHDPDKENMVEMVAERIDPAKRDLTQPNEIHQRLGTWEPENPATLAEKLFHEVTRLDLFTWFTVPNIRAMVKNIGLKDRRWELHCWIGDPANIPRLQLYVQALDAWLADEAAEDEAAETVAMLGSRDAYKEKAWLLRCLLVPLRGFAYDRRVLRLLGA